MRAILPVVPGQSYQTDGVLENIAEMSVLVMTNTRGRGGLNVQVAFDSTANL